MEVENKSAYKLLYPKLTVLVSSEFDEDKDVMTAAWVTPISFDPPLIGVAISPKRYSHKLIEKGKKFAINVPTDKIAKETYFVGTKSGREIDKEKETDLTFTKGETGVPILEECIANIECELVDNPSYGDHTLFIGKVKKAKAKEGVLEENGFPKKGIDLLYWRSSGNKDDYLTL